MSEIEIYSPTGLPRDVVVVLDGMHIHPLSVLVHLDATAVPVVTFTMFPTRLRVKGDFETIITGEENS